MWTCGAGEYGRLGDGGASDSPEFNPTVGIEDKVRYRYYIYYLLYSILVLSLYL